MKCKYLIGLLLIISFLVFSQTKIDTSEFAYLRRDTASLHFSEKEKLETIRGVAGGIWMFFKYIAYYPSDQYFNKQNQYFKVWYEPALYYSDFIKIKEMSFNNPKIIKKNYSLIAKGYPSQIKEIYLTNLLNYKNLYVFFDTNDSLMYVYKSKKKN